MCIDIVKLKSVFLSSIFCLLSVFGFSVYFFLPSGGLLEHFFLEFHFDLPIVFLSILPCIRFLMDVLDFSIYLTY